MLLAGRAALVSAPAAKAEGCGRIAFSIDFTPIKLGALVLVQQQVVGSGDVGKAFRRLGVILVLVGVQFFCQLAIGALDFLVTCALGNTQCLIGIDHFLAFFKSLSCRDWNFPLIFNSTVLFGHNGVCNLVVSRKTQQQIKNQPQGAEHQDKQQDRYLQPACKPVFIRIARDP